MNIFDQITGEFATKVAANPKVAFGAAAALCVVTGSSMGAALALKKRLAREQEANDKEKEVNKRFLTALAETIESLTKRSTV